MKCFWIYLYIYICTHIYSVCVCLPNQHTNTAVLHWLFHFSVRDTRFQSLKLLNKGHRWGQRTGLMHLPLWRTKFAGQWQPATHGLLHGPISFQLSQVLAHPGPQVSYTAPCLHWVARKKKKKETGEMERNGLSNSPSAWCHSRVTHCIGFSTAWVHVRILTKESQTPIIPQTCWESPAP